MYTSGGQVPKVIPFLLWYTFLVKIFYYNLKKTLYQEVSCIESGVVSVQTKKVISKFDHLIFIYGPRGFKNAEGFLPRAAPAKSYVIDRCV